MKYYGYARVSTDTQAEKGFGLEEQQRSIRDYARENSLHLEEPFFVDAGISGAIKDTDADEAINKRQALIELLAEKSENNISVRELAQRAGINRGTFYIHYKDIHDLVEQLVEEAVEQLRGVCHRHPPAQTPRESYPFLTDLFETDMMRGFKYTLKIYINEINKDKNEIKTKRKIK